MTMMVTSILLILLIQLLLLVHVAQGSERYGDICTKFATGETKPDENNGEWFCLKEDSYEYCQRYSCPDTACEDPKIPDEGVCKYCPGTCSYGGNVYPVGLGFVIDCLDKSNKCACLNENRIASSRIGRSKEVMCFNRYRWN